MVSLSCPTPTLVAIITKIFAFWRLSYKDARLSGWALPSILVQYWFQIFGCTTDLYSGGVSWLCWSGSGRRMAVVGRVVGVQPVMWLRSTASSTHLPSTCARWRWLCRWRHRHETLQRSVMSTWVFSCTRTGPCSCQLSLITVLSSRQFNTCVIKWRGEVIQKLMSSTWIY